MLVPLCPMFIARATRVRNRIGRYGFVACVVFLLALYIGDRFSGPPPNVQLLIWVSILFGPLFLVWGW